MGEKKFKKLKGIKDILPENHEFFTFIKKVVRHRFRQSGFRRIAAPLLQPEDYIEEFIKKPLYKIESPTDEKLVLTPSSTLGILKSYIDNGMNLLPQPVQLYSIEAEFHPYDFFKQGYFVNAQIIGEADPVLDAQLIYMGNLIFDDLGINDLLNLEINNVGCKECQEKYLSDLKDFYFDKVRSLCEKCKENLESNPFNLFNCTEEDCRILAELAPKIDKYLCEDCKEYKKDVFEFLDALDVKYEENPKLIFDFPRISTNTVFKFIDKRKQGGVYVASGSCYFDLLEKIGGEEYKIPARGYSFSMEKVTSLMKKEKMQVPSKDDIHVFVAQLGKEAKKKCLVLMEKMRESGIKSVGALGAFSINDQLELAQKFKVPYTLILGLSEVRENTIILRNMKTGTQEIIPFNKIISNFKKLIGEKNLDTYSPGEVLY